jgi:hypothetical protein
VSAATLIASMPLAKVPESWPLPVVAGTAMLALAALDFTGSVAAKEWCDSGDAHWLFVGVGAFLLLFYVYASSLQYAELALVTMGWIVLLQVGLLVLDHVRYGIVLAPGKLAAVVLILLLQAYLLVGPSASTGAPS